MHEERQQDAPVTADPTARDSPAQPARDKRRSAAPAAAVVGVVIAVIVGLSVWYLVQPQPLLVQGEVDSTRTDIAARVDGRVGEIPVVRGQNVGAGTVLVTIDNPELIAKHHEAEAAKGVAVAALARIDAGTRSEEIAVRKAQINSAEAALTLAKQTYDRKKQLVADKFVPQQQLDEATAALDVAQRGYDQARFAYQEAVAGFTAEEREIAVANVAKAQASIDTLKALVDQMIVTAPVASQVYRIDTEDGEFVLPGVPLLSLVNLDDTFLRFELREDLLKRVKVSGRYQARVPALGDRQITAEIKFIAPKGEYAGWRATRATGDFDLRTFEIRAYPIEKVPGLRPGMSVYAVLPEGQP
jgi:HlyD family secretion protein